MGLEQLPTNRDFLRLNKALPDHLQQCTVVIEFAKPMPRFCTENFYRIRMSPSMLQAGEDDFWKPELMQPLAVGQQRCLSCKSMMKRVGVMSSTCVDPICPNSGMTTITGPKRGVHSVKVEFNATDSTTKAPINVSFIVGQEWMTVDEDVWLNVGASRLKKKGVIAVDRTFLSEAIVDFLGWKLLKMPTDIVSGCLLVLDRRYSEQCLVAVHRTAGMLCDEMGWELKKGR